MGFAAHSRHTRPSKVPWPTDRGSQTQQSHSSRWDSAHSSPAGLILPPPSTFPPGLLLNLRISAAATEAGASSRQGCAGPAPRARHHLCDLPAAAGCQGEAFPRLTPSITQRGTIETPGRLRLFPGGHGRQQFHMPHTLYLSEALFLALHCIYSSCNTLWCNIQHAFKTHFSIYCQAKC